MKTPQEESEDLIEKAAIAWSLNDGPSTSINSFIRQEIPLPELIAVARAAQLEGSYQPDVKGEKFGYWISEEDFEKLEDAVEALRATGKVTL